MLEMISSIFWFKISRKLLTNFIEIRVLVQMATPNDNFFFLEKYTLELMLFSAGVQVRQKGSLPQIKFNYLNPSTKILKPCILSANPSCKDQVKDGEHVPHHFQFIATPAFLLKKRLRRNRIFDRTISLQRLNLQKIVLRQRSMEVRKKVIEDGHMSNNISKRVRKSIFAHYNPNNKGFFTRNPSLFGKTTKNSTNNFAKHYSKSHYFESQLPQLSKEPSLSKFLRNGTINNSQKDEKQKGINSQIYVEFSDQNTLTTRNLHVEGVSRLLLDSQRFSQENALDQTQRSEQTNRESIMSNQSSTISIRKSNFFPFSIEVLIIFMGLSIFFLQMIK